VKAHAYVSSRVILLTGLPIILAFEIFTSFAEESNTKLLSTNVFPIAHNASKMRWRPGSSATDPAEGAYNVPRNLIAARQGREKENSCESTGETERKERGRKK